ncbi:Sulphatase-modifying factor protein [Rhodopirellula baltica]|nr:Sulphatase-modifying factor protein [Rhodopirellula baltica]
MTFPDWATSFGLDSFGVYADFEIASDGSGSVHQRLRWIPPGRFQMGSPDDEPKRSPDEMEHDVVITNAFWMFETPCTQALWKAVMGENSSHFPDPERPVEKVDWDQANAFAEALTERMGHEDLNFALPTEAQWEYACRAGTTTPIYSGGLEIRGNADAPALDAIAWYGGNSGHEYDHEVAVDIRDRASLSERQYEFDAAGTRKVKQKRPNPWGLYDMLGNVWEWCSDWWGDYDDRPQLDPQGPSEGSYRVIRGGSWIADARDARSAYRNRYGPGLRLNFLGFRCLSSVKPSSEQVVAASSEPRDEAAEQRRTP